MRALDKYCTRLILKKIGWLKYNIAVFAINCDEIKYFIRFGGAVNVSVAVQVAMSTLIPFDKMKCMSFCSLCFIHFECNYRFYRKSTVVIFIIITKCFMECFCYFFLFFFFLFFIPFSFLLSLFFQVIIILVATGMENCGCKINAISSN